MLLPRRCLMEVEEVTRTSNGGGGEYYAPPLSCRNEVDDV